MNIYIELPVNSKFDEKTESFIMELRNYTWCSYLSSVLLCFALNWRLRMSEDGSKSCLYIIFNACAKNFDENNNYIWCVFSRNLIKSIVGIFVKLSLMKRSKKSYFAVVIWSIIFNVFFTLTAIIKLSLMKRSKEPYFDVVIWSIIFNVFFTLMVLMTHAF